MLHIAKHRTVPRPGTRKYRLWNCNTTDRYIKILNMMGIFFHSIMKPIDNSPRLQMEEFGVGYSYLNYNANWHTRSCYVIILIHVWPTQFRVKLSQSKRGPEFRTDFAILVFIMYIFQGTYYEIMGNMRLNYDKSAMFWIVHSMPILLCKNDHTSSYLFRVVVCSFKRHIS